MIGKIMPSPVRLVQLAHHKHGRRVAVVEEPRLVLISSGTSVYQLALAAIDSDKRLAELITTHRSDEALDYDRIYTRESDWKLLPAFDHPMEPSRCLVTGTGLTHKAIAENRQSMHDSAARGVSQDQPLTDSMKMYRIGLEGGRPKPGEIGAQPEWFFKGVGTILRAHREPLDVPNYSGDGGDEAEIAGCYVIASDGTPCRVGLAQSNEFSDHVIEARNYLYLSHSKLRACSLGPELVIDADFSNVPGKSSVERAGQTIWEAPLASGERSMSHTLGNLEHHHFKTSFHRRPG